MGSRIKWDGCRDMYSAGGRWHTLWANVNSQTITRRNSGAESEADARDAMTRELLERSPQSIGSIL